MRPDDKLRGWSRIWPAFVNTLAVLRAAWSEPAFHMETWKDRAVKAVEGEIRYLLVDYV